MSHAALNLSPDLQKLRDEGYYIQIKRGVLLVHEVPYVNAKRQVKHGILITELDMAGNQTIKPKSHVVQFAGEEPCDANGRPLSKIILDQVNIDHGDGVLAKYRFSSKPEQGYADYFEKVTTYVGLISGHAATIQPAVTARIFMDHRDDDDSVFNYAETASARVGISALTEKLATEVVAIIGLGGTGSYVLDLVAKTPVQQIRLFDGEKFLQHNAFRAPGAPSIEELRAVPNKVDHLGAIYLKMHRGIQLNPVFISQDNLHLLDGVTFAFICIDNGVSKKLAIEKLESIGASFVDVGMGLELTNGSICGQLRVTTSTPDKRKHVHSGLISFKDYPDDDLYTTNIQVAELNCLNASLAVLRWKKLRNFYHDLELEHHCLFVIDGNQIEISEC